MGGGVRLVRWRMWLLSEGDESSSGSSWGYCMEGSTRELQ
jgi:hypothetical protein